jgi:hypothetical protein
MGTESIEQARELTAPIQLTPVVERGYRAIRFEGRIGLAAVFGAAMVTNMASPTGARVTYEPGHGDAYELPLSGTVRKAA